MSAARETILGQIKKAVVPRPVPVEEDYARIPRAYRTAGSLGGDAILELFLHRLQDYGAPTYVCESGDVARTIAQVLTAQSKTGLVAPDGFPAGWLPAGFAFTSGNGLSYADMDASQGVLTLCTVAVAFTGTIILQDQAPGQGIRALTLVPDYHLCVIGADQIVETFPEAIRVLEPTKTMAITTISGPSATSDIEMTRIKGVHGPRTLEVIIVRPGNP